MKKILILGSGALKIGEAGEFDYSGSQAIKALKEEGNKTILVNPNIATIQTSRQMADTVYFLPVTPFFVERVIKKERPDGILLGFGGQTALNCGIELAQQNILKKYHVKILGTPLSAILLTEDRNRFAQHLRRMKIPIPKSATATSPAQALRHARRIGLPVMIRAGFALGGQGSGIAYSAEDVRRITMNAFSFVEHVLVEQYLYHYKEVEYEVVRDTKDNCVTICNMENMDPMGIHTGESIVVAPSQTLTNLEYHTLRQASIEIIRSLRIVGECNIQFALNPKPKDDQPEFYVIEVNARLSRSSALASKATGYPLAYVAAKLALGKTLTEIQNNVTKVTQSCFEPSLDYIVTKIPRWDMEKFQGADETIGSSMKSVGEVMGIGRTFEESFQKAIRMLDLDLEGVTDEAIFRNGTISRTMILKYLQTPTPKRTFAISLALKHHISPTRIARITGIDPWFIARINAIVTLEKILSAKKSHPLSSSLLWELKRSGFSDQRIALLTGKNEVTIRKRRKQLSILPAVFQIDTLAGEFPAKTNYLYLTYGGAHHDISPAKENGVIILGCGPYRIGSSVEFDWTSVHTVQAVKKRKKETIIINCNPETVSTDYDISDRLYFEELTFERIADIYDFEQPAGIIVSVGGQTPNNRAPALLAYGCTILGTSPRDIARAEHRGKFSKLLDKLDIDQPVWNNLTTTKRVFQFAHTHGYPILLRPSYVLSGTNMAVIHHDEELQTYLKNIAHVSATYPMTVSKFIYGAKEIEFDAVAYRGNVTVCVVSEHIENAGVHSGDATIVIPPQKVYTETFRRIVDVGRKLASAYKISGPFNIQFLAKNNHVSVIELNLRASRTFPFISKATGAPFIDHTVDAFFQTAKPHAIPPKNNHGYVCVKTPQFSFARLTGADPLLRVEMASTGEVACFGDDLEEAFLKAELAVGGNIPTHGLFLSLGGDENKFRFRNAVPSVRKLHCPIFATEKTAQFLQKYGVSARRLFKLHEQKSPNVLDYFQRGNIDCAINLVDPDKEKDISDRLTIRRAAVDHNIPLYTNLRKAELFLRAIATKKLNKLPIKSWGEYTK